MRKLLPYIILSLVTSGFGAGFPEGHQEALGPLYKAAPHQRAERRHSSFSETDAIRAWNEIAIDASGLDHTPVETGETRVFGEQLGPGRASRAMAIVHIAIFDAVNAIDPRCESYPGLKKAPAKTSVAAAVGRAAHDTLVALFPSQAAG